jgi:lipoprotein-anchoring transpeptidase ErfK/SrfK
MKRIEGWILAAIILVLISPLTAQITASTDVIRSKRTVLVSLPDRKLVVMEDQAALAYFSVAVGAEVSPSPEGSFEIVNRVANPGYYHAGVVMAAGKDNPVGTRWLGLNRKGYGIHGTNAPRSIGRAASHGCIRLRNRDVERLYAMLRVGDVVEIRGSRDEQTAELFGGAADGSTLAEANTSVPVSGQE